MKKYLFGLGVMAIAASLSAFTYAPAKKDFTTATYRYTSSTYTDIEYNKEVNWVKGTISCGTPGTKLCTIVAPDDGTNQPDFSALPVGGNVRTDETIIEDRDFKL